MKKLWLVIAAMSATMGMVRQVEAVDDFEWRAGPSDAWFVNWDKALAQARKTNKALFLLHTGSDWCGWCMKLRSEVLTKPEFEEFARENLVLVYLDSPRRNPLSEEQKAHNDMIVRALPFGGGVPNVLIVNANGEKLGSIGGGGQSLDAYLERVRNVLAADGEKMTNPNAVRLFTEGYDTPPPVVKNDAICEIPEEPETTALEETAETPQQPAVSLLALDAAPLREAFNVADFSSYKCRSALEAFETAIAAANAAATAQWDKITEIAKTYLQNNITKAQKDGDLDKVIAYEKALETIDGEIVGDAEDIAKLRNARAAQIVKINKGLVASGLTAASGFKGALDLQKKEKTQKGDIETAKKIASLQDKVKEWENAAKAKVQDSRQASAQSSAPRTPRPIVHGPKPAREHFALPTMTCKLVKTTMEEKNTNWHRVMTGEPVRVKTKSMTYEVAVRNAASTNETYQVCWYVIGENNYQRRISIVEKHRENMECAAGRTTIKQFQTKFYISSKASTKQENYANMSDMDSFKDIIVQLVRSGKVIRTYVSNKRYETQANQFPFTLQD